MRYAPVIVAAIAIAGVCAAVAVSQVLPDDDPGEQVIEVTVPYNIVNVTHYAPDHGRSWWSAHVYYLATDVPIGTVYTPANLEAEPVPHVIDAYDHPVFLWSTASYTEAGLYEALFTFEYEGYIFHPVLVDWDVTQSA